MKRRLIALMLLGVCSLGAMTGCSEEAELESSLDINKTNALGYHQYESGRLMDQNISVEHKGKFILHKGDIVYYDNNCGQASTSIDICKMKFDCGKEIYTNATYYLSDEMLSEDLYDEKCEECFDQQ